MPKKEERSETLEAFQTFLKKLDSHHVAKAPANTKHRCSECDRAFLRWTELVDEKVQD
mgnify:CR=1 FL=1